MAIIRYSPSAVMEYVGLSTDTKPTAANATGNVPPPKGGDRFIESDTGNVFIYTGSGWSAALTGAGVGA
ncbi:MAG: hypothetical protein KGL39_48680 [Patescibacteria group bacterium]|nr:hypothetical protein [Patescibacteria group bacterium]